jgi:hypothetical protein
MIAVRREVLAALTADPEWNKRLEQAKTMIDVERVLTDFCKARGIKIKLLEAKA